MWTILIVITIGIIVEGVRQERKMKNYVNSLTEKHVTDPASTEIRK
jgi:hypothetical protein